MTEHLDLSALRGAILSLEEGLAVVSNRSWFDAQTPAVRNVVVAGVIQNFEFVYELSIKMVRRQLESEAASPTDVDESSFRDLLRTAAERGLLGDVEAWFGYRKMRNMTAPTYDHDRARQVYDGISAFLADARALLAKLEARNA